MTLRSAVVGAGMVSGSHLSGLEKCPRTDLVAVCDIDEERARTVAAEYGVAPYFDVEDLLGAEEPDWIHVCTPVQTHLPLARRAIEAGVPVLIEKPIVESVEQFDELESAARRHGVPVSVVHQHLYDPAMRKATEQIRAGTLGPVRGVDLVFSGLTPPDEPNRGAWTFDLAGGEFEEGLPHPIYLALAASGYPASADEVQATTGLVGEYERDFGYDSAQVQYATADGALGSITMRSGSIPQRLLLVHGEKRSLTVDFISQTVVELGRNYRGSALARVRNNVDRARARLGGVVGNGLLVAKKLRDDGWEVQKRINPHYYQFDREARALESGSDLSASLERAGWTTTVLEEIRASARKPQERSAPRGQA